MGGDLSQKLTNAREQMVNYIRTLVQLRYATNFMAHATNFMAHALFAGLVLGQHHINQELLLGWYWARVGGLGTA